MKKVCVTFFLGSFYLGFFNFSHSEIKWPQRSKDLRERKSSSPLPRWMATPTHILKTTHGNIEMKILERFIFTGDTHFSIGNIAYLKVPKDQKQAFSIINTAEKVREAMGFSSWKHRRYKDSYVFESDWDKVHRYFKLFILEEKDSIIYVSALLRSAYLDSTLLESEYLQRSLVDPTEKLLKRIFSFLESPLDSFIPSVFAEPAACNRNCPPTDNACLIAATQCQNQLLTEQLERLNRNFENNSNPALNQAEATSQEWNRSNDIIDNIFSTKNILYGSALAAAGATLGVMIANVAVDGIVGGAGALYDLITGEKEKEKIWERFKKARENWEEISTFATQTEEALDSMILLKSLSKKFGKTREEILMELGAMKIKGKLQLEALESKMKARALKDEIGSYISSSDPCILKWSKEAGGLAAFMQVLGSLEEHLTPNAENQLCIKLLHGLSKLREAESKLQAVRAYTGDPVAQKRWEKEIAEEFKQMSLSMERSRDTDNQLELYETRVEEAQNRLMEGLEEIKPIQQRGIESCEKKKNIFKRMWQTLALSSDCAEKFFASKEGKRYIKNWLQTYRAYDLTVAAASKDYHSAINPKHFPYVHDMTLAEQIRRDYEWFQHNREHQAALMEHFDKIETKAKTILELCPNEI